MGFSFKNKIFTLHEDGDANFYTIFKEGNWFTRIQMNGEMTVPMQKAYLETILKALNKGI